MSSYSKLLLKRRVHMFYKITPYHKKILMVWGVIFLYISFSLSSYHITSSYHQITTIRHLYYNPSPCYILTSYHHLNIISRAILHYYIIISYHPSYHHIISPFYIIIIYVIIFLLSYNVIISYHYMILSYHFLYYIII